MKLPTRIIDEYGVIHALDARGLYVPVEEREPKVSGLYLMAMGIGTFAAAVLIGAYFAVAG